MIEIVDFICLTQITLKHTPINNPYQLFHNLYYEDTPHQMLDITKYDTKILKVIVP